MRDKEANLWVGWEPGFGMKSWKVFYAEKPYTNYILGADFQVNPETFTFDSENIRILEQPPEVETEARTLIQNVIAGRQYKARVYAYKTRTQNIIDKYGISREIYAPIDINSEELTDIDTNYLQLVAVAIPQELNSQIGEVELTWNNIDRDENGYDVEIIKGGSGTINTERLPSETKSYLIENLSDDVEYQFRLVKYDVDDNRVVFDSNVVRTPDRTPPSVLTFNSSMVKWIDQGANSGDNQVIEITIPTLTADTAEIQVIAVSGVGTSNSEPFTSAGSYFDRGVSDNQTISYKLRGIDSSGNYRESIAVSIVIGNRTELEGPVIT